MIARAAGIRRPEACPLQCGFKPFMRRASVALKNSAGFQADRIDLSMSEWGFNENNTFQADADADFNRIFRSALAESL
jgi:hypothetical protein